MAVAGPLLEMKALARSIRRVSSGVTASAEFLALESPMKTPEMDEQVVKSLDAMASGLESQSRQLRRLLKAVETGCPETPDMFG